MPDLINEVMRVLSKLLITPPSSPLPVPARIKVLLLELVFEMLPVSSNFPEPEALISPREFAKAKGRLEL